MSLARLLSPLAPAICFGCGAAADCGGPLCAACRGALRWLGPDPVALGDDPPLAVWAPLAYAGGAAALVRALKFRGAVSLAGPMAAQIAANAPSGLLAGALVPVPLSRARRRRRGFNQAALLARAIAARTGVEVADVLERDAGARASQVGRGRSERLAATRAAVRARAAARLPGRAVLVDDVVTTGATLRACAAALRGAGVAEIAAVAYARTGGR